MATSDPRFVVLFHELPEEGGRKNHFDLMLESGEGLWTWAIPQRPEVGVTLPSMRLKDHRKLYLDYEGEVSGNRGHVTRIMAGNYQLLEADASNPLVALLTFEIPAENSKQNILLNITRAEPGQECQIKFESVDVDR